MVAPIRGCTRCTTQVGWNWGTTRYTFDQMVAALSVYLHKYKDWPSTPHGFIVGEASGRADLELRVLPGVAKGLRLGTWVANIRRRRATLSPEEVASVEQLVSPSARHCKTHTITRACICDICLTGRGCTRCTTPMGWNWDGSSNHFNLLRYRPWKTFTRYKTLED